MKARIRNDSLDLTKIIWDLCVLNTLRYEFGFGEKRLKQFYEKLEETQKRFTEYSCVTDKRRDAYSNMDTAIIELIRNLDGINWQSILGVDQIIFNGKDLVKVADMINRRNDDKT